MRLRHCLLRHGDLINGLVFFEDSECLFIVAEREIEFILTITIDAVLVEHGSKANIRLLRRYLFHRSANIKISLTKTLLETIDDCQRAGCVNDSLRVLNEFGVGIGTDGI